MELSPSRLEDHLGYWLRSLSNQVSGSFADRLEKHGVSVPQWVVLRILHDHDSLSLKELGVRIAVDLGALSRMVERLLRKNLVLRESNPDNRREIAVSLTPAGRRLVPRLAREADDNDRAFFSPLSKKQQEEFLATIKAILAAHRSDGPRIPIN